MVESVLPGCVCIQLCTHVLNLLFQLRPCPLLGPLEVQMLQEVSSA